MTVYVLRGGRLVDKRTVERADLWHTEARSDLPAPMIQPRFETIESPVTGKAVTSWAERERDMKQAGAVDARDVPRGPIEKRKRERARPDTAPIEWGRLDRA